MDLFERRATHTVEEERRDRRGIWHMADEGVKKRNLAWA